MLLVTKKDITEENLNSILNRLEQLGIQHFSYTQNDSVFIHCRDEYIPKETLEKLPGVDSVLESHRKFRLVSREHKPEDTVLTVGDVHIGGEMPVIIAGPCAVESEEQILEIASFLKSQGVRLLRGGAFKPRTSPYSFAGLGKKGLRLLRNVKEKTGLMVVTEVLDPLDIPLVSEYIDIIQIGSRNMQNFALLRAVGKIDKPVLLKRGMSARLDELLMSAEYMMSEGNRQVFLCERGIRTFSEYSRNTLDLNVVPAVKEQSHLPIIVDPSHGTGRSDMIEPMSLAALAAGADGLMIEVHSHPEKSWSDPQQALSFTQFSNLMNKINSLIEWRRQYADFEPAY